METKSKSRIKLNSSIFSPYDYKDLIEIVKHKYHASSHKFDANAIAFLCKKVANINSDVRLLEKYYSDCLRFSRKYNKKVEVEDINDLMMPQGAGILELLSPYKFIIEILLKSPRMKNIAADIKQSSGGNLKEG
jgi:chromosomal replication initiation ATPase DnaA